LHERLAPDCFDQYKEFAMVAPLGSSKLAISALPQNAGRLDNDHIHMFGYSRASQSLGDNCSTLSATTLGSMMFAIIDIVDPYKGL
jgi:hypothetical protein